MDEIFGPIERMVCEAVREICEIKHLEHREPAMANIDEVSAYLRQGILQALRVLCRSGVLEYRKTVNHVIMFKPKEPT